MNIQEQIDFLKAVKAKIDTPETWLKNIETSVNDDGKKCYCVMGAWWNLRVSNNIMRNNSWSAHDALLESLPKKFKKHNSIVKYNDAPDTTHKDIMKLFDKTIARLEKKLV